MPPIISTNINPASMGCLSSREAIEQSECPYCHLHREGTNTFKRQPLSSAYSQIRPLDCIFFRADNPTSSALRKVQASAFGHGEFSHVGVVFGTTILPNLNLPTEELYVLEYVTSDPRVPDAVSGKAEIGVQLRRLRDVIALYNGDPTIPGGQAAWLRLKDNPLLETDEKSSQISSALKSYYDRVIHKQFDAKSPQHRGLMTVKSHPYLHSTDGVYPCAELAAGVYQLAGLLQGEMDCETIAPVELLCNGMRPSPMFEEPVVITK